jgi:hypothetical protein
VYPMDDAEFKTRLAEITNLAANDASPFRREYLQRIHAAGSTTLSHLISTLSDPQANAQLRGDLQC